MSYFFALDEEAEQTLSYSTPMLKTEGLPGMGQMSSFTLSLVSLLHEDPLVYPSQDCNELKSQNQSQIVNWDKAPHKEQRIRPIFTTKLCAELANHVETTHSSLPCLLAEAHSSVRAKIANSNFKLKQYSNKTIQRAQDKDKSLSKISPDNQLNSMELPIRKDGKYGWIIVFGAFLINMIIDGICLSFGIFYSEFLDYFGQGQSKTAWTGSVLSGTYSLLGK